MFAARLKRATVLMVGVCVPAVVWPSSRTEVLVSRIVANRCEVWLYSSRARPRRLLCDSGLPPRRNWPTAGRALFSRFALAASPDRTHFLRFIVDKDSHPTAEWLCEYDMRGHRLARHSLDLQLSLSFGWLSDHEYCAYDGDHRLWTSSSRRVRYVPVSDMPAAYRYYYDPPKSLGKGAPHDTRWAVGTEWSRPDCGFLPDLARSRAFAWLLALKRPARGSATWKDARMFVRSARGLQVSRPDRALDGAPFFSLMRYPRIALICGEQGGAPPGGGGISWLTVLDLRTGERRRVCSAVYVVVLRDCGERMVGVQEPPEDTEPSGAADLLGRSTGNRTRSAAAPSTPSPTLRRSL